MNDAVKDTGTESHVNDHEENYKDGKQKEFYEVVSAIVKYIGVAEQK